MARYTWLEGPKPGRRRFARLVDAGEAAPGKPQALPDDPMRLTRVQLTEVARSRGIDVDDVWTKREIIEQLGG